MDTLYGWPFEEFLRLKTQFLAQYGPDLLPSDIQNLMFSGHPVLLSPSEISAIEGSELDEKQKGSDFSEP